MPVPGASGSGASGSGVSASSVSGRLLALPVIGYRRFIRPLRASASPSCRFEPSCSAYAVEALTVWGPLRGSWLSLRRLGRCQPWGGVGMDPGPVKPARRRARRRVKPARQRARRRDRVAPTIPARATPEGSAPAPSARTSGKENHVHS